LWQRVALVRCSEIQFSSGCAEEAEELGEGKVWWSSVRRATLITGRGIAVARNRLVISEHELGNVRNSRVDDLVLCGGASEGRYGIK